MPGLYLDSSALAKLYVPEAESAEVGRWVQAQRESIPFSLLHELELTSALTRRRLEGEISQTAVARIARMIESDLQTGVLKRPALEWNVVFGLAVGLVRRHGSAGLRSLDSMHLACALQLRSRILITFDEKQRRAGLKEGLQVLP